MNCLFLTGCHQEPTLSSGISSRKVKVFHKKTRRGCVVRVAREHYLRDDIGCGVVGCKLCSEKAPKPVISDVQNSQISSLIDQNHLLILDTNILLHKADVLDDELFSNVIITQTVWDEVKHKSPPAYKKLYDAVFKRGRNWVVFMNEFCEATYCQRAAGETANDRNDRAIRESAVYYKSHLSPLSLSVLLITDDQANLALCQKSLIPSCNLRQYLESLRVEKPELLDKLSSIEAQNAERDAPAGRLLFPEHKSLSELESGIKLGKYKQGSFQVSRENYLEAYVYLDGENEPVFVQGRMNCNRAIHDDTVAIEMLPKEEWTCPAKVLKVRDLEEKKPDAEAQIDTGDDIDLSEDVQVLKEKTKTDLLPTARVVGVMRRNWRPYCGILMQSPVPGAKRHLFAAAERRIPRIRIETRQSELLKGNRIVVSIDSWPRDSRYPLGHYVKSLGKLGDRETENEVLLLEHDVRHEKFGQDILDCLPSVPWEITDGDRAKRDDLRHLNICSVDPPGCTDIDDALHCRELEDGRVEVGVHIADVSHFVHPGTAMDREASERSTTVYLIDQRIDMLPNLLSSDLCSLRSGVERFAFSVIWVLTKDGEELSVRYCKSVICSRASLTYAEAQERIDDKTKDDPVSVSLRRLNSLSKILRARRKANGALSLASMEIRFNIDSETHDPIDVQEKKSLETNSMVEEFMLLANITVATRITDEYPDCALLRRHPIPPVANYKPVIQAALSRGLQLVVDGGKALSDSLDAAVVANNPFFNTMLRMLTTRCMTQALYFTAGTLKQDQYYHYGLATPIYTHFTSPIRRFSDLMVHRLLSAAIGWDPVPPELLDKRRSVEQCNTLNYRHKMAQYASRASVLLNTHLYFKEKVEDLEGYVLMVRRNALQVLIPKYGLESAVLLNKDSPLVFDEEQGTMSAPGQNVVLRMFDRVKVQLSLDTKDEQHNKLSLKLVEPKVEGLSVEPMLGVMEAPAEEPDKKRKCLDIDMNKFAK